LKEGATEPNHAERGAFPVVSPIDAETTVPQRTSLTPASRASATPSPQPNEPESRSLDGAAKTKEILGDLETDRAKVFFRATTGLTMLVLAALPLLPGETWLRALTAAFCFFASVISLFVVVRATKKTYTPRVALATGVVLIPLAIAIIYYLGLFSAAATLLAVGIYFFGSSQVRKVAWATYLICAGGYFVVTLLIAISILPDLAVFSVAHVATMSRLYRVIMQQAIFGMTFYLARSTRRSNEIALERAQHTDLMLMRTEAQLLEAKGELDRALRPGEGRLSGQPLDKWQLGNLLGRGGMGEVYAATRKDGTEPVAIKLLHPNMLESPENVARFMREARATASVPSEHVARIVEVATTSAGVPYIVMELLEGHDLAWYLRRSPQLELAQVVEMVEHTARALSAVRSAGIVHRDLKPGNLFLTDTLPRKWKVLDFGLSKMQDGEALTKDQAVGTPAYMAPEQIRGREVDHLTDLYALTSIAYRALTGRAPFVGDEIAKILMDVLTRTPDPPTDFVRMPVEVELVLAIGLAKKRRDRFAHVEEMAAALRRASSGDLDAETRARGWAILKHHPWGMRIPTRM